MSDMIEGYLIKVEKQPDGSFVVSVPELPGCSVQVSSKEEISGEIREAMKVYLLELSSKKPLIRKKDPAPPAEAGARKIRR